MRLNICEAASMIHPCPDVHWQYPSRAGSGHKSGNPTPGPHPLQQQQALRPARYYPRGWPTLLPSPSTMKTCPNLAIGPTLVMVSAPAHVTFAVTHIGGSSHWCCEVPPPLVASGLTPVVVSSSHPSTPSSQPTAVDTGPLVLCRTSPSDCTTSSTVPQ